MAREITGVDFTEHSSIAIFSSDVFSHSNLFCIISAKFDGNIILEGPTENYLVKDFYIHGRIDKSRMLLSMICDFFVGDGVWNSK